MAQPHRPPVLTGIVLSLTPPTPPNSCRAISWLPLTNPSAVGDRSALLSLLLSSSKASLSHPMPRPARRLSFAGVDELDAVALTAEAARGG
jgi:hypothetical protein